MAETDTSLLDPKPLGPAQAGFTTPDQPPPQQTGPTAPQPMNQEDVQKLVKDRQAITDESISRIRGLDQQRQSIANTPLPRPATPKFGDIPKPPDTKPLNVFKEAQAPLIFLTAMGALASRNHGMGAMEAATGFLEGWQKGDQERMDRERQKWQDNVEAVVKENQVQKERYDVEWNNTQLSQQDRAAKIATIGASIRDEQTVNALRTGNLDFAYKLQQDRFNAAEKLHESNMRYGAGQAVMSPDAVENAARYWIKTGKFPPNLGRGAQRSNNIIAIQNQIAEIMKTRNETPEHIAQQQQAFAAHASGLRALEARRSNVIRSVFATQELGEILKQASDASPRGQFTIINKGTQAIQATSSNPKLAAFVTSINGYVNTYATAIGAGTPRVSDKEHAYALINQAMATGAIDAVIEQINKEMGAEIRSTRRAFKEMGVDDDEANIGSDAVGGDTGSGGWGNVTVHQ